VTWDELKLPPIDDPETLLEGALREQRRIVSGYKSNERVDRRLYEEALHPKHFAISLAGEPTLYPRIGELLQLLHSKNFTSFLVTNGLYPEVLSNLGVEPSQLYVSINAPDEETYRRICRPSIKDSWSRLNETLTLLNSFKCPTALRITLIKGVNDHNLEGYAKLIDKANSLYVEVKAYMYLGFSRYRLRLDNMPRHSEVLNFAERLAQITGYRVIRDSLHSRVVLLSRIPEPIKVA